MQLSHSIFQDFLDFQLYFSFHNSGQNNFGGCPAQIGESYYKRSISLFGHFSGNKSEDVV